MSDTHEVFELSHGKKLHRYTVRGEPWACMAYDHTPTFCRRCQPVDDTLDALLQHVVDGNMEARQDAAGEFQFKMTDEGNRQAARVIQGMADGEVGGF